jgi:beta-lactam-binding protein with PASTA domain
MQPKQYLRPCVVAMLAVTVTAGWAQERPCSELPPIEREFARAFGACRDLAPIINVAPIVIPVPNVVGLTFDDARARLTGFDVRRSYRASGEPGGTVLAQEPAPPARAATGAPITVVVSDGSLRQRPLVGESEIDGVRRPPEAPAQPRVVPKRSVSAPQQAPTAPVQRSAQASVPQTPQVTAAQRRSAAQSETVEIPNVVGRSGADASRLLADFKVDRIEVVANAAPSGQVLAQDPAPGTAVPPGSTIGLQMSDGSLANPAATKPAVSSAPSPATPLQTPTDASKPSVQNRQFAITSMSNDALMLIGVVLTGLVLGALLIRRRALGGAPAVNAVTAAPTGTAPVVVAPVEIAPVEIAPVEIAPAEIAPVEIAPVEIAPVEIAPADVVLPETDRGGVQLPEIRVAARLEAGETTIEFTVLEADETTLERSRELHE